MSGLKKRYIVVAGGVLLVALVAGSLLTGPGAGQPSPTPVATLEEPSPITARGVVEAVRQSKLSFRAQGQIARLPAVGDKVEEGQEIASLDTTELDLSVAQAEDAVAVAKAALAQAQAPARDVDLAAAQAAYQEALARHNQLLAGATASEIQAARVAVSSAEAGLAAAQARLKQLKAGPTQAELVAAESAVASARAQLAAARQRQEALDPSSPQRANEIKAAELALEAAKNTLWSTQVDRDAIKGLYGSDSAQGRAADARVAAAETAVSQAQAALDAKRAAPTPAETKAAAEAVASAQSDLAASQARLDQLKAGPTAAELEAATSAVSSAEAALAAAKAKLEQLQSGGTQGEREASAAQVAQAKAALDLRRAGPAPAELDVLKARVKQSETALAQARAARKAAVISSPLSGVVVWTDGNVGETVTPGVPVVVVADLGELQVKTTDLDEASATKVKVGQPVKVQINAFEDKTLDGTVKAIAPLATTTASGDANYTVTVALAQRDPALWLGMTTKVEFGVAQ